jgi:CRP/FNR family transcriptional regulator, dissimilatory nitrate respiration regulator
VADIERIVEQIPLFKGLPPMQITAIARIGRIRTYGRGEAVFTEGEAADGFYVAVKGRVKVYKLSQEGKEQILHIIESGEPFGEVAVFAGSDFPAHAEAIDNLEALFIPRSSFIALIEKDPSLSMNMLALLSRRLKQFAGLVENLSLREVPQRLATFLLYLGKAEEGGTSVTLTITKGQLASLLGTIPETLSRILQRMAAQGLIRVKGREILILDRPGLEEAASQGKALV